MFSLQEKKPHIPTSITHLDLALSHHSTLKILEWAGFMALLLILFLFWCTVMFSWPFKWSPEESMQPDPLGSLYTVTSTSPEPLPSELKPLYKVKSSAITQIPDALNDLYTVTIKQPSSE